MFTCIKAAQVCAFFAMKAGNRINILKLMKLLYLCERESMRRFESPLIYDHFVSMDHGPVLSRTLDLLNGSSNDADCAEQWDEWVGRDQYDVKLQRKISEEMLDRMSRADLEVMNAVWDEFGKKTEWELVAYTHAHCAEWKDPGHSSIPIRYEEVFHALGKSKSISREIANEIRGQRELDRVFASL
ncbi:MAG: Panacea domain-containing protein [Gammaproteobacteria bacterium]